MSVPSECPLVLEVDSTNKKRKADEAETTPVPTSNKKAKTNEPEKAETTPSLEETNEKQKMEKVVSKQYATAGYYNYRKDLFFMIYKVYNSKKEAIDYARKLAEDDFGSENVVRGVEEKCLTLHKEVIKGFTTRDGYDQNVYTVIEFDGPEEKD